MKKDRIHFIVCTLLCVSFVNILSSCAKRKDFLPERIESLTLVKTLRGDEAKNFLNKLHFQKVTDYKNEIGFYENESFSATIYITHYPKAEYAQNDFERMIKKISPANSVFSNPTQFVYRNNRIMKYLGLGQVHFVFAYQKKLYWISVDSQISDDFFKSYYELIINEP